MIGHQCLETRDISKTKRSICRWCKGGVGEGRAAEVCALCMGLSHLPGLLAQSTFFYSTNGCCEAKGIVPNHHFAETRKRENMCRKSMQEKLNNIKMRYKRKIVEWWCIYLCTFCFLSLFYPRNRRILYFEPELPVFEQINEYIILIPAYTFLRHYCWNSVWGSKSSVRAQK